tara:strand:+ start:680 stop:1081 length:402 start_codon:yes stop_codon:yes gene_type:complete
MPNKMITCNNYEISSNELKLLEAVREQAKQARSLPKIDVFKACELVQLDIDLLTPELLSIFVRSLPQAFGRLTHFLPAGTLELSWDEKWLISLVSAISRADYDSVHFLIKAWIKPVHQKPCQSIALHLWNGTA